MNENLYTYAGLRRYAEKQSDRIEELEAEVKRLHRKIKAARELDRYSFRSVKETETTEQAWRCAWVWAADLDAALAQEGEQDG